MGRRTSPTAHTALWKSFCKFKKKFGGISAVYLGHENWWYFCSLPWSLVITQRGMLKVSVIQTSLRVIHYNKINQGPLRNYISVQQSLKSFNILNVLTSF